ncbi:root allergen protein-like protein [Tanacetum coccineum]
MSVIYSEIEVSSSLFADKLFKLFHDFDTLGPKLEPQNYKTINLLEGNGGVGSIESTTYGDAIPFTSAKHKIDAIDASNCSVTYMVFKGDALLGILDLATHHIKFVPSADGGAVFKDNIVLNCKGDAKLTEETLNQYKELLRTPSRPSMHMPLLILKLTNSSESNMQVQPEALNRSVIIL